MKPDVPEQVLADDASPTESESLKEVAHDQEVTQSVDAEQQGTEPQPTEPPQTEATNIDSPQAESTVEANVIQGKSAVVYFSRPRWLVKLNLFENSQRFTMYASHPDPICLSSSRVFVKINVQILYDRYEIDSWYTSDFLLLR